MTSRGFAWLKFMYGKVNVYVFWIVVIVVKMWVEVL